MEKDTVVKIVQSYHLFYEQINFGEVDVAIVFDDQTNNLLGFYGKYYIKISISWADNVNVEV